MAHTGHRRFKSSPVNGFDSSETTSPFIPSSRERFLNVDNKASKKPHLDPQERFPVLGERSAGSNTESKSPSPKKSPRKMVGLTQLFVNNKSLQKSNNSTETPKDKENTTPPATSHHNVHTPIWAQYSTPHSNDQPLSDHRHLIKESKPTQIPETSSHLRATYKPSNLNDNDSTNKNHPTRGSRVQAAVQRLDGTAPKPTMAEATSTEDLDAAFEAVLISRNIPQQMRPNMRALDPTIKANFIKNDTFDSVEHEEPKPSKSSLWSTLRSKSPGPGRGRSDSRATKRSCEEADDDTEASPSKRSRSRGRAFTFGKGERSSSKGPQSPSKRPRSLSRPRSLMSLKNLSSSSINSLDGSKDSKEQAARPKPDEFLAYLREETKPQRIEVGRLHKLRLLLRNESVAWVDRFISKGGMQELLGLLKKVMQIEWREEHEDLLLHEVLLCLKALSTTEKALMEISNVESTLFPDLLRMIFDEERKGPSEFTTRNVVTSLIFTYLAAASVEKRAARARTLLAYLSDPQAPADEQPVGFVQQMHQRRPYLGWCREVGNVTKEIFWIFLHHYNVIPAPTNDEGIHEKSFASRHFPRARAPVPAAPYVGGPEWEATNYIASHLDLINGLISSLPTVDERNTIRGELRASGFEQLMGRTLRLCKEKFYGAVHDGLKTWTAAASEDEWRTDMVRQGPPKDASCESPSKSPEKNTSALPPQLQLPQISL